MYSTKTQLTSAYDSSAGVHALASSLLGKRTSSHVNTDVNNNGDSQAFENPQKNNHSSTSFGDAMTTTTKTN